MLEIYEDELEKIISGLEQELDSLLKERKRMFFTFKLDRQVLRIKNLLKKYKSAGKKLKDKPKTRKTIIFIRELIRKILGLNLIASKLLTERKDVEQEESLLAKQESKEYVNSKESPENSEEKETAVKKSKEKNSKPQSLPGKESLFTHVDKEDISSLPSIYPTTLDVHLVSLLELEKSANDFAFIQSPKETKTVNHDHDKSLNKKIEEPIRHVKTIVESKVPGHMVHLTEEIKKHHDALLNILNKETILDTKEHQLRESNLYNTKQLYLLNNYLLHNQGKRKSKNTITSLEFAPLLIGSLVKLEVLMQAIEKYLLYLAKAKKQKNLAEKYHVEMKKYGGITRIEYLARIKNQQDLNASYVQKHKLSKAFGNTRQGNL